MVLPSTWRERLQVVHFIAAGIWFGSLMIFMMFALTSLTTTNIPAAQSADFAMKLCASVMILPASITMLAIALVQAVRTSWAVVRHYWVIAQLLLTTVAFVIFLLNLGSIEALSVQSINGTATEAQLRGLRLSLLAHAIGELAVLLSAGLLSFHKLRGMTNYGIQHARADTLFSQKI